MMKPAAELHEGAEAFNRFRKAVKTVLSIPKSALPPKPHRAKKKTAKRKA
jgi:hypothetical protein